MGPDHQPGQSCVQGLEDAGTEKIWLQASNGGSPVEAEADIIDKGSLVVLNDNVLWSANDLTVVNTFSGNGGTVTYCAPISFNDFILENLNRSDFAFNSIDAGFAASNGYFFDGTRILAVPAGGSAVTDTMRVHRQSGAAFSAQWIDLTPYRLDYQVGVRS